jgi:hypothetical protein
VLVDQRRITQQAAGKSVRTAERDSMTMQIPAPLGNKDLHNTANVTTPYLEFTSCPDCSMIATVQWAGSLESTEGPITHVRVTCVHRHWFLIPANTLT